MYLIAQIFLRRVGAGGILVTRIFSGFCSDFGDAGFSGAGDFGRSASGFDTMGEGCDFLGAYR